MTKPQEPAVDDCIRLSPQESAKFNALVSSPELPNEALRAAMARFRAHAQGGATNDR